MRSTEQRLAAVRQRACEIETKRSRRRSSAVCISAMAAALLIILGVSFFIPSVPANSSIAEYFQEGVTASVGDLRRSLG